MNEKIKELAIQANLNSDVVPYHLSDYDLIKYPQVDKFAELIAKECFAAAMQASRGHINPAIMIEEFEKRLGFKVALPNNRN